MPSLDLPTIIFVTGVMGALLSLVLDYMRRSYPASIRGLTEWATGAALLFLSALLIGARSALPPFLSAALANLILLAGVGFLLLGSCRFHEIPVSRYVLPAFLLLCTPPILWWGWLAPDYNVRLALVSILLSAMFVLHAKAAWKHDRNSFAGRFTLIVLSAMAIISMVRASSALTQPEDTNLFSNTPTQLLYVSGLGFGMVLLTVGLVLQASERLRQELQHLVTHDMLTGVLSRRALIEQGAIEIERSRRHGQPLSILLLDLDHFKQVNDQHGHQMGDQVLKDFARRVQPLLRRPDQLGRLGGEEFMVLLPNAEPHHAEAVAQRILASACTEPGLPRCTVSIGCATLNKNETLEGLVSRADAALYRAKDAGRNRLVTDHP